MNKSDFNYVYYRYVDLAHYVANSVVHDYHLAQDVCQEIFIKLYLNINGLDEERVKGWILVTAENTAIDFLNATVCGNAQATTAEIYIKEKCPS